MSLLDDLAVELERWADPLFAARRDGAFFVRLQQLLYPTGEGGLDLDVLDMLVVPDLDFDAENTLVLAESLLDLVNQIRAPGFLDQLDLVAEGANIADALTFLWLERHHPIAARVLELATLYRPFPDWDESRLRLGRIPYLIKDPVGVLREEYFDNVEFSSLDPQRYASRVGQRLFPRLAGLLKSLGVWASTGFPAERRDALARLVGNATGPAPSTLCLSWNQRLGGTTGFGLDVLFAMRSAPAGPKQRPLSLTIVPVGTLSTSLHARPWSVEIEATGAAGAVTVAPGPTVSWESGGATGVSASVRLICDDDEEPAFRIGSAEGTRLEIGRFELGASGMVDEHGLVGEIDLSVVEGHVVLLPGKDGFLRSVLPPDGMDATFDLGIVLSSETGLHFDGSVDLNWELPTNIQLGPITIQGLAVGVEFGSPLALTAAATIGLQLGPLGVSIKDLGLKLNLDFDTDNSDKNLGFVHVTLDISGPSGLGLGVDCEVMNGGGFITFDKDLGRYEGYFGAGLMAICDVDVFAVLETKIPDADFSFLMLLSAEFPEPGIELGSGVKLMGVGGMVGIHRTLDLDALSTLYKDGRLKDLMFPDDAAAQAPAILRDLRSLFPAKADHYVFGPMLKLGWGYPTFMTAEIGVFFEIPSGDIGIIGQVDYALPDKILPLIEVHADIIGGVRWAEKFAWVDGKLSESRMALSDLEGEMAIRVRWGKPRDFVVTVGGFHPKYQPDASLQLPEKLKRIAGSIGKKGGWGEARLVRESYFAITSNTLQFGAGERLTLKLNKFDAGLEGGYSFDALLTLSPFSFEAELAAWFRVWAYGFEAGFEIRGGISGPNPFRIWGCFKISLIFDSVRVPFDVTLSDPVPTTIPPRKTPLEALKERVEAPACWSAGRARSREVQARSGTDSGLIWPDGTLEFRQGRVPLDQTLDHFEGRALDTPARLSVLQVRVGEDVVLHDALAEVEPEDFALAQFQRMSDHEKLTAPAFTALSAGFAAELDPLELPLEELTSGVSRDLSCETRVLGRSDSAPQSATPPDWRATPSAVISAHAGISYRRIVA